ncbi:hypothetical protein [Sphingomonas sp. Leaf23]|uniref:hypothetical protein n=1 Tax=Sphingomonas sp. Leaf23 TaxID=1735689 RepID=UPI000A7D1FC5|nr:hypothetical protein [Sphingomonas sp. Leaf23]
MLIDRPGSDQTAIFGRQKVATLSPDTLLAAGVATSALAGDGMGQIARALRETKGWTYSVAGQFDVQAFCTGYRLVNPVQQYEAGASLALMRDYLTGFVMPQDELDLAVNGRVRSLPGELAALKSILDAMCSNDLYRRPRRLCRPTGHTLPYADARTHTQRAPHCDRSGEDELGRGRRRGQGARRARRNPVAGVGRRGNDRQTAILPRSSFCHQRYSRS